ncbi:MAG: LacI family DNA-binding transcriptional regulator [Tepidisphaeraceae bacterium]
MAETASILEVALKAGVSTATVSRVLNRSAAVAPDTAEAVLKCVRELGYELPARKRRVKSSAAAGRKQIAVIGVTQPHQMWLDIPVIARAVRAVTRAAREQGFGVLLEDVTDPDRLNDAIDADVAGVVVWYSSTLRLDALESLRKRLPLVRVLGDQVMPVSFDHVAPNNRHVGLLAAEYLLNKGCKEVLFVTDRPHVDLSYIRADGFFQAAERSDVVARSILVSSTATRYARQPAQAVATFAEAANAIAAIKTRPLGIFGATDLETAKLSQALAARGIKIGNDVIRVSCDNDSSALGALSPRPATIDLEMEEVGSRAFAQLMTRIANPTQPPVQVLVTPRLVEPE